MDLFIVNRSRTVVSKSYLKNWVADLSVRVPEVKKYTDLTLVFVSSAEMQILNKKYRGRDYVTDVLSFSPVDFESVTINDPALLEAARPKRAPSKSQFRQAKRAPVKPP